MTVWWGILWYIISVMLLMLQLSQKTVKKNVCVLCCQLYRDNVSHSWSLCTTLIYLIYKMCSIMPRKERLKKQDMELQQAAQGSSSLLSWIRPSTSKTNKGESVTLPGSEEPIMDEEFLWATWRMAEGRHVHRHFGGQVLKPKKRAHLFLLFSDWVEA